MTSLAKLRENPVYFYTNSKIAPFGQGSSIRVFTNIRAYLDLGFDVHVICFQKQADPVEGDSGDALLDYSYEVKYYSDPSLNIFQKIAYQLGFPRSKVLDMMYFVRPYVISEVRKNNQDHPHAIHHFEYDDIASAAYDFKDIFTVWSNLDIFSTRLPLLWEMRAEFKELKMTESYKKLRMKRARQAEDWLAKNMSLVLNIAEHEFKQFSGLRGYQNAELLPMSWPFEERIRANNNWMPEGKLRLLHLGSVDGFVGYDSLRFIIGQVFPLLPENVLSQIELFVAGKYNQSDYSAIILDLAHKYPQVKFLGFVEDIDQLYGEVDLQVVGGERATGLRTRIIESFVYGVPVISTTASAEGIVNLVDEENILLAGNAQEFAEKLIGVVAAPACLPLIADNGRVLYDSYYSRSVASEKLGQFLEKHL